MDIGQKTFSGGFGVGGAAAGIDVDQLAPHLLPFDQAHAGAALVHPERQRGQDAQGLGVVDLALGPAIETTRQVPGAQEGFDIGVVKLRPPFGQGDALAFHQGQNGEQQRVGGQLTHPRIATNGGQQFAPFLLRLLLGQPVVPLHRPFQGVAPFVDKLFDLGLFKIDQRRLDQSVNAGAQLAIADNAAGQHKFVARLVMVSKEGFQPFDQRRALGQRLHLIQAIHQQQGAPLGQKGGEQFANGQGNAQAGIVVAQKLLQGHIAGRQRIGIGGERDENGQVAGQRHPVAAVQRQQQRQIFKKSSLAGAGVAQHNHAVMRLQEVEEIDRFTEPFAHFRRFFRRHLATGQPQRAGRCLTGGQFAPGAQRHIHFEQRQLERHSVVHAHAFEVEVAVACDQPFEVGRGDILDLIGAQGRRLDLLGQVDDRALDLGQHTVVADNHGFTLGHLGINGVAAHLVPLNFVAGNVIAISQRAVGCRRLPFANRQHQRYQERQAKGAPDPRSIAFQILLQISSHPVAGNAADKENQRGQGGGEPGVKTLEHWASPSGFSRRWSR